MTLKRPLLTHRVVRIALNHLFQTSQTGLPGEYGTIEETISPEVLTTIGDWVVKHSVKK